MLLLIFAYTAVTFFGQLFHVVLLILRIQYRKPYNPEQKFGLDCSRFARRLLRESLAISFPALT